MSELAEFEDVNFFTNREVQDDPYDVLRLGPRPGPGVAVSPTTGCT